MGLAVRKLTKQIFGAAGSGLCWLCCLPALPLTAGISKSLICSGLHCEMEIMNSINSRVNSERMTEGTQQTQCSTGGSITHILCWNDLAVVLLLPPCSRSTRPQMQKNGEVYASANSGPVPSGNEEIHVLTFWDGPELTSLPFSALWAEHQGSIGLQVLSKAGLIVVACAWAVYSLSIGRLSQDRWEKHPSMSFYCRRHDCPMPLLYSLFLGHHCCLLPGPDATLHPGLLLSAGELPTLPFPQPLHIHSRISQTKSWA